LVFSFAWKADSSWDNEENNLLRSILRTKYLLFAVNLPLAPEKSIEGIGFPHPQRARVRDFSKKIEVQAAP
jgi:hypothetical protein